MSKRFIVLALCLLTTDSIAQRRHWWRVFQHNSLAFGACTTQDFYTSPITHRAMYGVGLQFFIGKHVSLNNRLLFGKNPRGELMLHYGLGGVLTHAIFAGSAGIIITGNILENLLGIVLLPLIFPEGIQFHIGKGSLQISPYIYPASFEYKTDIVEIKELKAIFETGLQFRMISKEGLLVAPGIGWKIRYGDGRQAISAGLFIGLDRRKKKTDD